jgi:hypothetical protein
VTEKDTLLFLHSAQHRLPGYSGMRLKPLLDQNARQGLAQAWRNALAFATELHPPSARHGGCRDGRSKHAFQLKFLWLPAVSKHRRDFFLLIHFIEANVEKNL